MQGEPPAAAPEPSDVASIEQLQTLAVHLHRAGVQRAERHAALVATLDEERVTNAAVVAETAALRAEVDEARGRLSGELEGGDEHRAMKALLDERERREVLEQQILNLRDKLQQVQDAVKSLARQRQEASADEVIDTTATDVLAQLKTLL